MTSSTLADWLQRLERLHPRRIELGLDRLRTVSAALGRDPGWKPAPRVISVAGTNGKGTTVWLLEAMLSASGLRAGSYTSPHLVTYNERVRIDRQAVSDDALCAAFERVEAGRGDTPLTYFEFGTLAALDLLHGSALDVAILEVGMGGRLDAVNIVDPDVAVISSIGIDHVDWLGPDRDAISREKAGIMRPGKPVVIAEPDPPPALAGCVAEMGARAMWIGRDFELAGNAEQATWRGRDWDGRETRITGLAPGPVHPNAAAAAIQALVCLTGEASDPAAVRTGLAAGAPPARCQLFEWRDRRLVVDVAHNEQAARRLRDFLDALPPTGSGDVTRVAVIGMLRDKPVPGTIRALLDWADHWLCVPGESDRGMPADALATEVRRLGPNPVETCADTGTALERAAVICGTGATVVAYGSFAVAGAALAAVGQQVIPGLPTTD